MAVSIPASQETGRHFRQCRFFPPLEIRPPGHYLFYVDRCGAGGVGMPSPEGHDPSVIVRACSKQDPIVTELPHGVVIRRFMRVDQSCPGRNPSQDTRRISGRATSPAFDYRCSAPESPDRSWHRLP
jgi:hypothetical protein